MDALGGMDHVGKRPVLEPAHLVAPDACSVDDDVGNDRDVALAGVDRCTDDLATPIVVEADDSAAIGDGGPIHGSGAGNGEHEPRVIDRGVVVDVPVGEVFPRQGRHVGVCFVEVEALVQLADPPAAGEVVHPHRRAEGPGDAAVDQPVAFEDRQEEREDLDEVRGVVPQPLALAQRLIDETDVTGLEVAQAAVDHLGALRGGARGEVLGFDEGCAHAARGGVESDPGAGDPTANDQDVEALAGQPTDHRRPIERLLDGPRRRHARIIGRGPATTQSEPDCLWTGRIRWF